MSAIANPYGFRPVKLLGSQSYAGATHEYPMNVNASVGIFNGDLVGFTGGSIVPITGTPTTTWGAATTPVGVCVGVRYTDVSTKQQMYSQQFPAGGITAGYTNVFIEVADDPDTVFQVQAVGTIAANKQNYNAAVSFATAGSTVTGVSGMAISASPAVTGTLAVRIVDFAVLPGFSAVGDAYTDCLVVLNAGVHAFRNSTGG